LSDQHIEVTDQEIQQNLPYLKWEIKREIFTSVFGLNAGYEVDLERDPQLNAAVAALPQAKALYAKARKIATERQANADVQP
jgi:hypothetical protein